MVKKRPGHVPERTCIGCGKKSAKQNFLRVVRLKDGSVIVTMDSKVHGRSAYVCPNPTCVNASIRKLEAKVKIKLSDEEKQRVKEELLKLLPGQGEE